MAVESTDLTVYLAATGASDGGAQSATPLASGELHGLWPQVAEASRVAGGTRSKKWFIANEHPADALQAPAVWVSQAPTGFTEVLGLGVDSADDDDPGQGNMVAWAADEVLSAASSGADTRVLTVVGIDDAGNPTTEELTLTGAVEVQTATVWSRVLHVVAASLNGNTVTIREGPGSPTVKGTIGPGKKLCFLWVAATSQATGLLLPDLPAGSAYGFWDRQTWPAGVAASRPTREQIALVETA